MRINTQAATAARATLNTIRIDSSISRAVGELTKLQFSTTIVLSDLTKSPVVRNPMTNAATASVNTAKKRKYSEVPENEVEDSSVLGSGLTNVVITPTIMKHAMIW